MGEKVKKVPLNRLVRVETFEKVKALAVEMGVAEGVVIDRVVAAWVESVEQVIKAEEIGESEWGREVLGRLRMLPETFMGTMDEYKSVQAEKKRESRFERGPIAVEVKPIGGLEPMGAAPMGFTGSSVLPINPVEKPFRVMCQHCGVKFGSESLKETTCEGCGGKDHKGSRYECEVCRYG
jgi:hypothetical protein